MESRTWYVHKNWFEKKEHKWELGEDASTHATVRALGIREKFGKKLDDPWISQYFAYGKRLRPYVLLLVAENHSNMSEVAQVDIRAWEIFTENAFSSGQITCEFLRSSDKDMRRVTYSKTFWKTFPTSAF